MKIIHGDNCIYDTVDRSWLKSAGVSVFQHLLKFLKWHIHSFILYPQRSAIYENADNENARYYNVEWCADLMPLQI